MALRSSDVRPISARCLSAELSREEAEEEDVVEDEEDDSGENLAEPAEEEEEEEEEDRCLCLFPLKGRAGHVLFLVGARGPGAFGTMKFDSFLGPVNISSWFARAMKSSSSTFASS